MSAVITICTMCIAGFLIGWIAVSRGTDRLDRAVVIVATGVLMLLTIASSRMQP